MREPEKQQLDELTGTLCRGELDDEGIARLEDLLADDPEAQARYVDYIQLVCDLRHYHGTAVPCRLPLECSAPAEEVRSGEDRKGTLTQRRYVPRWLWGSVAGAAAIVLLAVSLFSIRDDSLPPNADDLFSFTLWRVGEVNDSSREFSQERNEENEPPGSPFAHDDDYYFAGVYEGFGTLREHESFRNFDRAVRASDPRNRIHFRLGKEAAAGDLFRLTVDTFYNQGDHPFSILWNGKEVVSYETLGVDETFVKAFSATELGVVEGENVVTIESRGSSGWVQFDHITLEVLFPSDEDSDRDALPDRWESFFFPGDLSQLTGDGDYDGDGVIDIDELAAHTDPTEKDTDGDGLQDGVETNTGTFVSASDTGTSPTATDTDGDGLEDGEEVVRKPSTDPLFRDSDQDGFDDVDELNLGHDPADPNDHPRPYIGLWKLGENDDGKAEFSLEDKTQNEPPGSPFEQDDDYYFAGTYQSVGEVAENEELRNFDRALVDADPRNRIHFVLKEEPEENDDFRLTIDTVLNKGSHPLTVLWNGQEIYAGEVSGADRPPLQIHVTAADVRASKGENVLTIERGGSGGWIQFDAIALERAERVPDVDNDGLPDAWERTFFPNDLTSLGGDSDVDRDGLTDGEEFSADTNPTVADSDGDGIDDFTEWNARRPVAILTRSLSAEWEPTERPPEVGVALAAGKLSLNSGLAQIEFYCGATVVIEGPAEFDLVSAWKGVFHHGKIRVNVPSRARGFTVETNRFKVVDIGTEFGLQSDGSGGTEVQVFQGTVEIQNQARATQMTEGKHEVAAGSGVKFDTVGKAYQINADDEDFVSEARFEELSNREARVRHQRWLRESERIRKDDRVLLYYSFERQESWERELRNQTEAAAGALDGAIVGCQWVEGRWPSTTALEFRRPSDRIRIDLGGEYQQLTMAAWIRFDRLNSDPTSLMCSDASSVGAVHWTVRGDGKMVLSVKDTKVWRNYRSKTVEELEQVGRWVHLAISYDAETRLVKHYCNGRLVNDDAMDSVVQLKIGGAEIGNWGSPVRHVPIRHLDGRLGEFAVFSRALDLAEVRKIYEDGKEP